MNIKADCLAKLALLHAHSSNELFDGAYFIISFRGIKSTGLICSSLELYWGRDEARQLFNNKNIISNRDFAHIWWEGFERAMASYPKIFCILFLSRSLDGGDLIANSPSVICAQIAE